MSRRRWSWGWLLVAGCVLGSGPLPAQETEKAALSETEIAEMAKIMAAMSRPGEHHQRLEALVGDWNTTTRVWMAGPDVEPLVAAGKASNKWILDGRFLMQEYTGTMMKAPFNGLGLIGFDNFRRDYQFLWIDNLGTMMLTARGSYDEAARTFTFHGLMDEPATDEQDKKVVYVIHIVDDDKFTFGISYAESGVTRVDATYVRERSTDEGG